LLLLEGESKQKSFIDQLKYTRFDGIPTVHTNVEYAFPIIMAALNSPHAPHYNIAVRKNTQKLHDRKEEYATYDSILEQVQADLHSMSIDIQFEESTTKVSDKITHTEESEFVVFSVPSRTEVGYSCQQIQDGALKKPFPQWADSARQVFNLGVTKDGQGINFLTTRKEYVYCQPAGELSTSTLLPRESFEVEYKECSWPVTADKIGKHFRRSLLPLIRRYPVVQLTFGVVDSQTVMNVTKQNQVYPIGFRMSDYTLEAVQKTLTRFFKSVYPPLPTRIAQLLQYHLPTTPRFSTGSIRGPFFYTDARDELLRQVLVKKTNASVFLLKTIKSSQMNDFQIKFGVSYEKDGYYIISDCGETNLEDCDTYFKQIDRQILTCIVDMTCLTDVARESLIYHHPATFKADGTLQIPGDVTALFYSTRTDDTIPDLDNHSTVKFLVFTGSPSSIPNFLQQKRYLWQQELTSDSHRTLIDLVSNYLCNSSCLFILCLSNPIDNFILKFISSAVVIRDLRGPLRLILVVSDGVTLTEFLKRKEIKCHSTRSNIVIVDVKFHTKNIISSSSTTTSISSSPSPSSVSSISGQLEQLDLEEEKIKCFCGLVYKAIVHPTLIKALESTDVFKWYPEPEKRTITAFGESSKQMFRNKFSEVWEQEKDENGISFPSEQVLSFIKYNQTIGSTVIPCTIQETN